MFHLIKDKVKQRFDLLAMSGGGPLLQTNVDSGVLFQAYLQALPEGERQEHNCNCCRSFLNHYGSLVTVSNGEVQTLWDFEVAAPYTDVPASLHAIVKAATITGMFFSHQIHLGTDSNVDTRADKPPTRWTHFYAPLPRPLLVSRSKSIDQLVGQHNANKQVFHRALTELRLADTEAVLELIAQNSLYRGTEFKAQLQKLRDHQRAVAGMTSEQVSLYVWEHIQDPCLLRNTSIGTLLIDLAEGRDLDQAVTAYERIVAPSNYRRPTAIVTRGMLDQAEKTLTELGLERSLYRRHATADDIPVGEVLFVNRDAAEGSLFDKLKDDTVVDPRSFSRVEEVPIETFIKDVPPTASRVEALLEDRHVGNLMNLTAPKFEDAPGLFNWDNGIAWAYKDGVADSIKERVKKAGGRVEGDLRISLGWFNFDDLDLHVEEPDGTRIYFRHKCSHKTGGSLDVDMNAGSGESRSAVENVIYPSRHGMLEGVYRVIVNNYRKRESVDTGFNVEIEFDANVLTFASDRSPSDGNSVEVARIAYSKAKGFQVAGDLTNSKTTSREVYGLGTQKFQRVSMIVPSPNYWSGNQGGNSHLFFILDGAHTDQPIRGFFNEYLKTGLNPHRKVFELLGEKVKVEPTRPQLAGLGFSSTQRDDLLVRVTGAVTRIIKLKF